MKHLMIPPPAELANYVKYFWTFEVSTNDSTVQISTLVNSSSGITILLHRDKPVGQARVQGVFTRPEVFQPVSSLQVLGVLFYPQAINELFGIHASEFTNQEIHLNDFADWNVADALFNESDLNRQIALLVGFLTQLAHKRRSPDYLVKSIIHSIHEVRGMITVAELKSRYAVNERQLERRFNAAIGVSPRHYIKVTRFQEAVDMLKTKAKLRLTDVAYALNYADQAHFIRHVKQLSGTSPGKFRRKLTQVSANERGNTRYVVDIVKNDLQYSPDSHEPISSL